MVVGDMIVLDLVAMNTPTEGATAENTVANSRGCNGREINGKEGRSNRGHISQLSRCAAVVMVVVEELYWVHRKCRTHQGGYVAKGNTSAEDRGQNCGKAVV